METETASAPAPRRPRTWLLVLLGIVVIAAVAMTLGRSAEHGPPASNPSRPPQQAAGDRVDPPDVRVEILKDPMPVPDDSNRNPFRFKPKPPPPAPPPGPTPKIDPGQSVGPQPPPPPPGPPPITLKFIGVTEAPGIGKIAALTDCRITEQGREGETVYGRYRIVKIGIESLVIEYTDGQGRTTLRMSGQGCSGNEK